MQTMDRIIDALNLEEGWHIVISGMPDGTYRLLIESEHDRWLLTVLWCLGNYGLMARCGEVMARSGTLT